MVTNKINITKTDPIRVRFSSDAQIRNIKPYGTVVTGYRDKEGEDPIHDFFVSIKTKDTKPYEPDNESFKETIDKVIEQFDVKQDHIRTHKPNNLFKTDIKKDTEWHINIEEKYRKFFETDNKYDMMLDKLEFINPDNKKIGKVKL